MNQEKERILIETIKKDKQHYRELYTAYAQDLYRYSYSLVNDKEKAEDLVSEAFAKGFENIDKFKWTGVSIKAWLITVARNCAYKQYAKEAWLPVDIEVNEMGMTSKNANYVNEQDMIEDISKYLRRLPDTTREIIVLKIWEEFTFEEIAQILGKKESTVKMEFYRGLEKMKQDLVKDGVKGERALFPVIFASIGGLSDSENYRLGSELLTKNFTTKLLAQQSMSSLTKAILIGGTAVLATVAVVIGSYLAAKYYQESQEDNRPDERISDNSQVENSNDASADTSDEEEEQTEEEIVAQNPYEGWEYYHSEALSLGFYYPDQFEVFEDSVNGNPYLYLTIKDKYPPPYEPGQADFKIISLSIVPTYNDGYLEPIMTNPAEMHPIMIEEVTYVFDKYIMGDGYGGYSSFEASFLIELGYYLDNIVIHDRSETYDPASCANGPGPCNPEPYDYSTTDEELAWARLVIESIDFD